MVVFGKRESETQIKCIRDRYCCIISDGDGGHFISQYDRRMTCRWERGCGSKVEVINLELNCVAMATVINNGFATMVEWDIGSVGRQWPCLCHWRLPSTGGQERISWLPFTMSGSLEIGDRSGLSAYFT